MPDAPTLVVVAPEEASVILVTEPESLPVVIAVGMQGPPGINGREVEIRKDSGYVQWRYTGDADWVNLIALSEITGAPGTDGDDGTDGREVEISADATNIRWRYVGDAAWTNIVTLASLRGTDGLNAQMTAASTSSVTIGSSGTKTFVFSAAASNLGWVVGTRLRAANSTSQWIEGAISALSTSQVSITADLSSGSGTKTSWNLSIAGVRGAAGINGQDSTVPGPAGAGYLVAMVASYAEIYVGASISLAIGAGLAYSVGARVRVTSTSSPANYAEGTVSGYDGYTLSVGVDYVSLGSYSDSYWSVNLAGNPGSQGTAGADALPLTANASAYYDLASMAPDYTSSVTLSNDVNFGYGTRVRFAASPLDYFEAIITSKSTGYIEFQVALVVGTSSASDWSVSLAGERGTPGTPGLPGSDASVNTTNVGAVLNAATAQTTLADTDKFSFIKAAGAVLSSITWASLRAALDAFFVHLRGGQTVQSSAAGVTTLTLKAAAGATANIFEAHNSGGSALAWISATGSLTTAANLAMPATTGTTGIFFIGANRGFHTYGSLNVFAGVNAGNLTMTGNSNSGVGYESLLSLTDGSANMGFGYQSLRSLTSGNYNVGIGRQALFSLTTGSQNTALGRNALYTLTGAAGLNVAMGDQALFSAINGIANTAVGTQALQFNVPASNSQGYNTAIGYATAASLTTGQRNVFIGALAGYSGTQLVTVNDSIAIGYDVKTTANNQINIGNTIYGDRATGLVSLSSLSVSGNITGNGTSNTLPNQTLAGDSSILTHGVGKQVNPFAYSTLTTPSSTVGYLPIGFGRLDSDVSQVWGSDNVPALMLPFLCTKAFQKISVNHTSGTNPTATLEIAIYNVGTDGKPTTLVEQGTVSLSATGIKTLTLSQPRTIQGLFYIAMRPSVGTTNWAATGGSGTLQIKGVAAGTNSAIGNIFGCVRPSSMASFTGMMAYNYSSYTHPFPADLTGSASVSLTQTSNAGVWLCCIHN